MKIECFTFNPFQENTYVLFDETKQCVIIDPGCSNVTEEQTITNFIAANQLQPTAIVNTHNHIDHVLGINVLAEKYNLPFYCHEGELQGLRSVPQYASIYGINVSKIMEPTSFIDEHSSIQFGNTTLEVRFTPGHSPASVCFIHHDSATLIAGDVLFAGSIGRTDLPGGNYERLMKSIVEELLSLPDHYTVYPGHGASTSIGEERKSNPYILEWNTLNK